MSMSNMYQLENLIVGLLESINDKNTECQESISESLVLLGKKKAEFVLKTTFQFLYKNVSKLADPHKAFILAATEKIVKDYIESLDQITAQQWIELASNEMISSKEKEVCIALQTSASNLLVAIGIKYVKEVFTELKKNFTPGQLTHVYVLNTMANLAEVNPFGVVPNLIETLAAMLPMVGMAKLDTYKCAVASALCKFSEAILYYCSNKEKASDQTIEKSNFSTQIYAAHEIFFNAWLKTNDPKLRQITIEAIGHFVNLIATDKLEADIQKIIPGLMNLYKRHTELYVVSQSLYFTISAAISATPTILSFDLIFEPLVKELFAQLLTCIESQSNKTISSTALSLISKNQNEILRCFTELTLRYSDRMLPFLLQKFEQNNEKTRICSLTILKHLINSSDEQMDNKKQIVLSGLRTLLSETNNKVKKHLMQSIIAMAYHGYLNLEGGQLMLEFILKQCSLPDDVVDAKKQMSQSEDSNENLRIAAENILTLFSTTVENMHDILWPNLLEYLCNIDFSRCMGHLCKNMGHIAEIKRNASAPEFMIKFNEYINLPKPFEIFARLIVLCGTPMCEKNRGLNVLLLMKQISPNLHPSIVDLWDNVVPKLILNLEEKTKNSKFVQKTWDDLIMKLLSNSLDQINEEESLCEIAKAFGKHIETLYMKLPDEKQLASKCLGLVLSKTTSKSTIDKHLDIIFNSVNHTLQSEREGCAISFGYTGSSHLDTVLSKLETLSKSETKKSSGGLFSGLLNSKTNLGNPDQVKATIVLSYGYVTFYAPKDLIISRLEANILRSVSGYSSGNVKEITLKQNILKSIDLITKCMHQDHLQKDFNFSYKPTILNQIITYINSETSKVLTNEVKSMLYKICSNIIKLNPKLTEADIFQIIKSSTDGYYSLQVSPPVDEKKEKESRSNSTVALSPVSETASNLQTNDESNSVAENSFYEMTAKSLDELLNTILERDLNNDNLKFIFKYLEPWIISVNEHERFRSIRSLSNILQYFTSNFNVFLLNDKENDKKETFDCFGPILGHIVSRVTDPVIQIRILAMDCIESLIKALQIYSQTESNENEKQVEYLTVIKQKLVKTDSNVLLSGVSELAKLLCRQVPAGEQLVKFIDKLINGLLDVQTHCSSASCIFLNHCVKLRGGELKDQVENLINHLYTKLSLIQNPQAKTGTLRTIRTLFQQHLVESFSVFLTFPIPCNNIIFKTGENLYSSQSILIHEDTIDYKRYIWLDHKFYNTMDMIDICQNLCEDEKLIGNILDHLLKIWTACLPYDEKANVKYASITPLIGTCILKELFANNTTAATEQVFNENFEKLYSNLLVRVSSTLSNVMPYPKSKDEPTEFNSKKDDQKNSSKQAIQNEYKKLDPCKISIECFKSFIKCTQSYDLFEYYEKENIWELLGQDSTNIEGCTLLAKGLCLHGDKYIKGVFQNLNGFLSAPYECQKISVTAFFAELINHNCTLSLVEPLMNNLLTKLIDTCTPVRTLCIRGLGNVSSLGKEEVQKHSTTILSAMMAGLDDKDDLNDDITFESMNGLTKIIALIDENNVRPILINILLRIRPCFEKDKPAIRASAYMLFGELARFGKGPSKDPYMEQIHSNFVSFVLHLNEKEEKVRKSCKYVLKQVGPLIGSDTVNDLFQTTLLENKSLHFGEFINNLSKLLVNEFPEKVSFYIMNNVSNFKSQWTEIRSNSVLFAGYLLGHLHKDKQSVLSKEHISNALIKLLKEDPTPQVRQKAAEAISLLSDF